MGGQRLKQVKHRNFDFWCVCPKTPRFGRRSTLFFPPIPQKRFDLRTSPELSMTCLATLHELLEHCTFHHTLRGLSLFSCVVLVVGCAGLNNALRTLAAPPFFQSHTSHIPHADQQLEKFGVTQCVHKTRLTTYRNCLLVSNHLCGIL